MDAARTAGLDGVAVWLAGCAGTPRPAVRSRVVMLESAAVPGTLSAAEVAAAVDAGRALAARSAAAGVTVLGVEVVGHRVGVPACALAAVLTGRPADALARGGQVGPVRDALARHAGRLRGPLGALRRLAGEPLARACGIALGAGESGLAFVAAGLGATAAAALALRVEPTLAPRVRVAAGRAGTPAEAALREALALEAVLEGPGDVAAALAALRRGCAVTAPA